MKVNLIKGKVCNYCGGKEEVMYTNGNKNCCKKCKGSVKNEAKR